MYLSCSFPGQGKPRPNADGSSIRVDLASIYTARFQAKAALAGDCRSYFRGHRSCCQK